MCEWSVYYDEVHEDCGSCGAAFSRVSEGLSGGSERVFQGIGVRVPWSDRALDFGDLLAVSRVSGESTWDDD